MIRSTVRDFSRFASYLVLLAAVLSFICAAQAADMPGSSDHPLVGRFQGSEIVGYQMEEFDEAAVVEAPFDALTAEKQIGPGFKTLEGKVVLIYYKLPQGTSTLEVLRNYEDSLKANGFTVVFSCTTAKGTCFTSQQPEGGYLLGQAVGNPLSLPKLMDDYVHNWFAEGRYLLAKTDRPEGAIYAALYLGESPQGNVAVVKVVETKEMETGKIEFVRASEMEQAIGAEGRINLYGIQFDFDKDAIKPESKPTLDEIAKLLTSKPDLKIKIIGHTDNQGTPEYNLDLSQRRAANVAATLAAGYGIDIARLTAEGAGLSQPIAPNDTDEGQAKNRRVELIAQ